MKVFREKDFTTADDGVLVAEASTLQLGVGERMPNAVAVVLANELILIFHFSHCDMSGEDIAGWNYTTVMHHPRIHGVLIIND